MHPDYYKNVIPYIVHVESSDLTVARLLSTDEFREYVKDQAYKGISSTATRAQGFTQVRGETFPELYVHEIHGYMLCSFLFAEKKIKQGRFRRLLAKEKAAFCEKEGKEIAEITVDEEKELLERVRIRCLKNTDEDEYVVNIIIDLQSSYLFMDDANKARRNAVLKILKQFNEELSFLPIVEDGIQMALTHWVKEVDKCPKEITVLNAARFQSQDDAVADFRKQEIMQVDESQQRYGISKEIIAVLNANKFVKEIMIDYNNRCQAKLTDSCELRGFDLTDSARGTIEVVEEPVNELDQLEPVWLAQYEVMGEFYAFLSHYLTNEPQRASEEG